MLLDMLSRVPNVDQIVVVSSTQQMHHWPLCEKYV